MTHAHTTRTIASLGIVLAALVAPKAPTTGESLGVPAPRAPTEQEIPVEAAPLEEVPDEPAVYALDVDATVYITTIAAFEDAGFDAPEFLARFHTSDEPCKGHCGLNTLTSDGVSTVNVCATHENELVVEMIRERTLMHEVAHVWVEQNVSQAQRAAFMAIRGLDVWEDGTLASWEKLGAEHAAEILLWGMTDETRNINFRIDDSDIANLRAAYRILTEAA